MLEVLGDSNPVIIGVGASDGSTSLDFMEALKWRFLKYDVTDKTLAIGVRRDADGRRYFYDGRCCILTASNLFLRYPQVSGLPIRGKPGFLSLTAPPIPPPADDVESISLVYPGLRARERTDPRVVIWPYDFRELWEGPSADVVKVANVWNRSYFDDATIVGGLQNLRRALTEGGWMLLVENRDVERVSLFRREGEHLRLHSTCNEGVEITDLATSL